MHHTTGIQTGQVDEATTSTAVPSLNPSTKGATTVNTVKKLSTNLYRTLRQPLVIYSSTKIPTTFRVASNTLIPKLPAILNPIPTSNAAAKGPANTNPATMPTIPNPTTIFADPNNNSLGLKNLFKAKLPVNGEPSIATGPIIASETIPIISATIKRPAVFSLPTPATGSPPKRYTSPLKRPANAKNAHLPNLCQCNCKNTKLLVNVQTNTVDFPIGIVPNNGKTSRKRSTDAKNEGPPSKKIQDEDGEICPICLDSCTNSGDHRLVALKCGHLFGAKCIETWLRTNKKCPTCQRRAILPDLRNIYARKLAGPDPVVKPSRRSIGVRAVKRSRRRRRRQKVNSQANDQCFQETI